MTKRVQNGWKFTELEELYNIPASTMARDVKRILNQIKTNARNTDNGHTVIFIYSDEPFSVSKVRFTKTNRLV